MDCPYILVPNGMVPVPFDVLRGTKNSVPRGWRSVYYGTCQPTLSVGLSLRVATPCRLLSVFAPEKPDDRLSVSDKQIRFESSNLELVANLLAPDAAGIIQDVLLDKSGKRGRLTIF